MSQSSNHSAITSQKRKRRLRRRRRFMSTIFLLVIVVSVGAFCYNQFMNSKFLLGADPDTGKATDLDDSMKSQVKDAVNILICGIDDDDDRDSGLLTDTIMLLHWDIKENTASVLQIPRDTYVGDVTYTGKINAVFNNNYNTEIKGINGLATQIHDMFDVTIDYYATITMKGFRNIIDQIGGVEFDSPMEFEIDGVTIQKGSQVFDGIMAEKFVRFRSGYQDGDLGRLDAQRQFFSVVIEKMLSLGKTKLVQLVPTVMEDVTTNMTVKQALDFAGMGSKLDTSGIQFFMVPGETVSHYTEVPCYREYGAQDIYSVHKDSVADMLNEYFRPYTESVSSESLNCIEVANTDTTYNNSTQTVDKYSR